MCVYIYILVILFILCYRRFTNFVVFFFTVTFHEGLCPIQLEMTTKPMKVTDRSRLEHHSDSRVKNRFTKLLRELPNALFFFFSPAVIPFLFFPTPTFTRFLMRKKQFKEPLSGI